MVVKYTSKPSSPEAPWLEKSLSSHLQMILSLFLLLISSSQQHGSEAEFNHSNKFQHDNVKEQNGVQDHQHEKIITIMGDGVVHSPDFPLAYPRNKVLVWRLVAENKNARIQLTFDDRFGLEDPEDGICKYDFVEIEEPGEATVLGRWCGSQAKPGNQVSRGNQIRIRFVSDEFFPSEPGFSVRYSLLSVRVSEPEVTVAMPAPVHNLEELSETVAGFNTVEEVMKYLEPERWQLDMEDLHKPTWHVLGKSFIHHKKSRGAVDLNLLKEEVRLYSCTPRNFSVSLREELRRTDAIFWPNCLLVKRCGGNCACCSHRCHDCQCIATKVTKKYHEVRVVLSGIAPTSSFWGYSQR
uniref:Platelet-derived growth factor C n=1 Tax=Scleropages formosus TaxID=113540 RepID=A0A8C9SNA2_SCLFO